MNITIVGAGNVGTQFAVHCAEKGHRVTFFTSKPNAVCKDLKIIDADGKVVHKGTVAELTDSEKTAFENAELIFVTVPAFCMESTADKILPYAKAGMRICLVPGTGGGECAFRHCIEKGAVLFGLQRVPSVARIAEAGRTVRAIGYRDKLYVAAMPVSEAQSCARLIEGILDITSEPLPNYLNITLTPSNPILHTARLKTIFKDYRKDRTYSQVPLFYEEWDDETSKLLLECDEELQCLCRTLTEFDLSYVKSLRVHYESFTEKELTRKIRSIAGFKGLPSPVLRVDGGYIPDFESRYFTADFPYGLAILVQIAEMAGLEVIHMHEILEWYYNIVGEKKSFQYSDYGILNISDFKEYYKS